MSFSISLLSSPDVSTTLVNSIVVKMPDSNGDGGDDDDDDDDDDPLIGNDDIEYDIDIGNDGSDDEAETLIPDTLPHYSSLPPLFDSPLPSSSPLLPTFPPLATSPPLHLSTLGGSGGRAVRTGGSSSYTLHAISTVMSSNPVLPSESR